MSSYYDLAKARRPLHEYAHCIVTKVSDGTIDLSLIRNSRDFDFEDIAKVPADKAGAIEREIDQTIAAARALVGVL